MPIVILLLAFYKKLLHYAMYYNVTHRNRDNPDTDDYYTLSRAAYLCIMSFN